LCLAAVFFLSGQSDPLPSVLSTAEVIRLGSFQRLVLFDALQTTEPKLLVKMIILITTEISQKY
jgi:hypothetical protein